MQPYLWARRGDVNAFFGLMLDNVAVMIILFSSVVGEGKFTPEFVLTRMIPGTALGVLVGDLIYTWMAFRLAKRTGRQVTAMPLGLDTPSTFGVAFLVLNPTISAAMQDKEAFGGELGAMNFAWGVGLLSLVFCGVFKLAFAPLGNAVRRLVPRAGLLGSLAAIALALIAFLPMLLHGIGRVPVVGLVSLVFILVTLVAHRELPFRFPGALAAVLVGVVLFWVCRALGVGPAPRTPDFSWHFEPFAMTSFYGNDAGWWGKVFVAALNKLPVVIPFALATIVGGIDCTESAAAAGDEYDTRAVLLTEGFASLVAGLLGGVIQTTPYIGHPAYKKMGGAAAYTLATAVFVGVVGYLGGFTFLFYFLPEAAMFPILVFVGLEITAQSFHATPIRHYPALALAILPALAALVMVALGNLGVFAPPPGPTAEATHERLVVFQTLRCLSNGFLISGLLWSAALTMILDGKLRAAAAYFAIAAVLTLVGLIHSPFANDRLLLPWQVNDTLKADLAAQGAPAEAISATLAAMDYQTPYHWAAAYGLVALVLLALSLTRAGEGSKDLPLDALSHPPPEGGAIS